MTTGQPQYVRIADQLRQKIKSGELAGGTKLPSEQELRRDYNVSAQVVRASMAQLRAEGLIVTQQGTGTFVQTRRPLIRLSTDRYKRDTGRAPFMTEVEDSGRVSRISYENVQVKASDEIAERLSIEPGAAVTQTKYWFYADEQPVQLSTQWEPQELTGGTTIETPEETGPMAKEGIIARFDSVGIYVVRVHESVQAQMPTPDQARQLDIAPGTPVFEIHRTHWTDERPVETANIIVPTDRYTIEHTQEVSGAPE